MRTLPKPLIQLSQLEQVCFVVHDIDKTMKSLWDTFGIGPWNINLRDPDSKIDAESITDMTYYGKPARFGYLMASTRDPMGGIRIELIQPAGGDSIHRDFLRDHGEGVQHLGWHIVDSQEALARTTKVLEQAGFPCIMSGRLYSSVFAYFDTTKVLNTILEVVWRDPTRERPAPIRVFPEQ
ncbi:VOC family protein [Chloroflexota bacterium]